MNEFIVGESFGQKLIEDDDFFSESERGLVSTFSIQVFQNQCFLEKLTSEDSNPASTCAALAAKRDENLPSIKGLILHLKELDRTIGWTEQVKDFESVFRGPKEKVREQVRGFLELEKNGRNGVSPIQLKDKIFHDLGLTEAIAIAIVADSDLRLVPVRRLDFSTNEMVNLEEGPVAPLLELLENAFIKTNTSLVLTYFHCRDAFNKRTGSLDLNSKSARCSDPSDGDYHIVSLAGYELDEAGLLKSLKFKNSWGEDVGDMGYMKMSADYLQKYGNHFVLIQ